MKKPAQINRIVQKNFINILLFVLVCIFVACNIDKSGRYANKDRVQTLPNALLRTEGYDRNTFDLQGHRGARGLLPENSIPGFLKALELGVNTLEMDVVVSKDSQIVVSHEPFFSAEICLTEFRDSILPTQEKKYNIYQYTLAQIQKFDCGSKGNKRFPEQKKMPVVKPSLREVIFSCEKYRQERGLKPFVYNIETKSTPETDSIFHPAPPLFAELLYRELKNLKLLDRVTIQSFDVRTLQAFKKLNEEVRLVLLVENKASLRQNLDKLGFLPSAYSPYFELVSSELVRECHELGMKIVPWTVNEVQDMERLKKLGVDGLITDYPNRFKRD